MKCSGLLLRADAAHVHKVKLMSTLLVALDAGVALLAAAAAPAAPRRQLSLKMNDCRPLLLLMLLAVVDNSFALPDSGWISWL